MLGLIATIKVRAGEERRVEELLGGLVTWVRANEPGTLLYELFAARDVERTYRIVEEFADQAAWDRHREHPHVREVVAQVHALLEDKSADFVVRPRR